MGTNIDNRTIEKIKINVIIDKPHPMPVLDYVQVGEDNKAVVARNEKGTLLAIFTKRGESTNAYIVDVAQIVEGILAHEGK